MDQSTTPLVTALQHCANRPNAAFYTPGHKRGQGITSKHRDLFGAAAFRADLPELPELDNLFAPEGVILQAQQLAAEAFGAQRTWFLANGSTCGIEAAILATCGPGDKLIVPRNVHSSAISGLILAGAVPIYISPNYSSQWDMPTDVAVESIKVALQEHPDAKAVLIVSPTYQGVCSNLSAIAALTHRHNIPLIVDEAHGPHFAFHPELPTSALAVGADIVIQSAHKVLSAFTQAAMLHVKGNRIDHNRLSQSLQLTQSTSPSYLLLGSLDAARYQMATEGTALLSETLKQADRAATELNKLPGLSVLQPRSKSFSTPDTQGTTEEDNLQGLYGDRTRITVDVSALNITGFQADDIFHTQHSITAELPSLRALTFIISLGNTKTDIDQLTKGFTQLSQTYSSNTEQSLVISPTPPVAERSRSPLSPRQAFFAVKKPIPVDQSIGHISAETICPYPPGIPTILPGELITENAIAHLQTTLKAGGIITGCADPTLKTVLTVKP